MDPLTNNNVLLSLPPLPNSPTLPPPLDLMNNSPPPPLDLRRDNNSPPTPWHDLPDGERSPHILGYGADGSLVNFYQMLLDELIEDGVFNHEDDGPYDDFDNPAPMPLQLDDEEEQIQVGDVIMLNIPHLLDDDDEEYTEPPELYPEPDIDYEAVD